MSIPVTVLIYAGIPLAIVAVMAAAVFLPGEMKSPGRYRPGRPWQHKPSWYLPHEISAEPAAVESGHGHAAIGHAPQAALAASSTASTSSKTRVKAAGGASGEW